MKLLFGSSRIGGLILKRVNEQIEHEIRPDQRWRLANGTDVLVEEVSGAGEITCAVLPTEMREGFGPTGRTVGVAAAGPLKRSHFVGAELLSPRYRASFGAKVDGKGLEDRVMQRLQEIGSVERRGTPRIDTGPV